MRVFYQKLAQISINFYCTAIVLAWKTKIIHKKKLNEKIVQMND